MSLNEHRWQKNRVKRPKVSNSQKPLLNRGDTPTAGQMRHVPSNDGVADLAIGTPRGKAERKALEAVTVIRYEITDEPLPDRAFDRLAGEVQAQINALHDVVLGARPKQAIEPLLLLIEQYPDVAQLYNYLYIAYYSMGKRIDASRVVQETIRRFPEYLFGNIALAEEYLTAGKPEKIKDVFGGKFDLKLLYPKRVRFHVTEVLHFQNIMARYHFALGNQEQADRAYDLMCQINPKHPSTRHVRSALYPSGFLRWLRDLLRLLPKGNSK